MAVALIIETPTKQTPSQALGAVLSVFDYSINRELNRIGTFSVQFAVDEPLGVLIKRGWRITIVEDYHDGVSPPYLMYRGIVMTRRYVGQDAGASILELNGLLRSQELAQRNTHTNQVWVGETPTNIALALAGYAVSNPGGAVVTVTFNEITNYAGLLRLGELKGWHLREDINNSDEVQFINANNVPDSGYTIQSLEDASGDLSAVHEMKIALVSGTPTIEFIGDNIATRVIPVGNDTIDDPSATGNNANTDLTLEHSTRTSPYAIRMGTNPDGSHYWYIQDDVANTQFTDGNPIELYLKRTDVINAADNPVSRTAAANVLYDLSAQELIQRRSEFINFQAGIANGNRIWMQPGDAVRVEYEGWAYNRDTGKTSYIRLTRYMQVVSRSDHAGQDGEREVDFKVSSPAFVIIAPTDPTNIIMPAPPGNELSPMDPYALTNPYGSIPTATPSEPGFTDPGAQVSDGTEPAPEISLGPSDLLAANNAAFYILPDGSSAWSIASTDLPPNSARSLYAYDGGVVYVSGNTLKISTDNGISWSIVTLPHTGTPLDTQVSRADGRTWLLIDNGTNVFLYVYDGTAWTLKLTLAGPLGFHRIGLSLIDPLKVAVSHTTGGGNGKAWYTTDGGTTWTDIGTTDPSIVAQQLWFWTNTGRMVAAQGYSGSIKIEYSDSPYVFFPVDHTALSDATTNVSGVTSRHWMLARDAGERGAIFLAISANAPRIYRSTDNCTTFTSLGAFPVAGGISGIQYDYSTDKLYLLMASGATYYITSASTRTWTTVIAGDWVAMPSVGASFDQDASPSLALLLGGALLPEGEII